MMVVDWHEGKRMVQTNNYNLHNILKLSINSEDKSYLKYLDRQLWFFRTRGPVNPDIEVSVRRFKFPLKARRSLI